MTLDLSVLLVVRNWSLERLELSLDSLKQACAELKAEVVLLDYGSDDPEPYRQLAQQYQAKYHRAEAEIWSRSRAVNIAAEQAEGKWLLFADADMLWSPRSLSRSLQFVMEDENQYLVFQARDLPETHNGAALTERGYKWEELEQKAAWRPRWGMGMQLVHRDKFRQVQGLDERMTVWGGEDNDMARRLQAIGLKQTWVNHPEVRVYHIWHEYSWHAASLSESSAAAVKKNKEILKNDPSIIRNMPAWEHRPNSSTPLVSVVIVTRDRCGYLKEALDSVLNQTFQDFEVVIIDDGSTDESEHLVAGYNDERMRYFRSRKRGVAAGRNQGAEVSRGHYTAVHDDDDIMLPWSLEVRLASMHAGDVGSYGGFWNFNNATGELELMPGKEWSLEAMYSGKAAGHPTILLETDVMRRIGYDESIQAGSDYKFRVQSALAGYKMQHCGDVVTLRRMHPHNMSVVDNGTQRNTSDLVNSAVRFNMTGPERKALRTRTRDIDIPLADISPELSNPQRVMPWLPPHLVTRIGIACLTTPEEELPVDGVQFRASIRTSHHKADFVLIPEVEPHVAAKLESSLGKSGRFAVHAFPTQATGEATISASLINSLISVHEEKNSETEDSFLYEVAGDLDIGVKLTGYNGASARRLLESDRDVENIVMSPRAGTTSLAKLLTENPE